MKINWTDKIRNEEVLAQVKETRTTLHCIWTRKHRWTGHVLWRDELLCNHGRKNGWKPTRDRRRLQMLEDLYENNSYEVMKRTAEDRSAWRESTRKKVSKTSCTVGQLKKK